MRRLLIVAALVAPPALASDAWFGGISPGFKRVAAGAAAFFDDTFTDTAGTLLTAHTGESGHAWSAHASSPSASATISAAGRIYATATGNFFTDATPPSANYTVKGGMYEVTPQGGSGSISVLLRATTGTGSSLHGYMCAWGNSTNNTGRWRIGKWTNGTFSTLIESASDVTINQSQEYAFECDISGTATTTITMRVDGVQVLTIGDSSSPITGAGVPGARISLSGTSSTSLHMSYVQAVPL